MWSLPLSPSALLSSSKKEAFISCMFWADTPNLSAEGTCCPLPSSRVSAARIMAPWHFILAACGYLSDHVKTLRIPLLHKKIAAIYLTLILFRQWSSEPCSNALPFIEPDMDEPFCVCVCACVRAEFLFIVLPRYFFLCIYCRVVPALYVIWFLFGFNAAGYTIRLHQDLRQLQKMDKSHGVW